MNEPNAGSPSPDELERVVHRLSVVEENLKQLSEERTFLRERIIELMVDAGHKQRDTLVDGQPVVLRVQERRKVRYDEERLRQRLGERYRRILAPDTKKMRKHAKELGPVLEPHLELIGTPTPDLVQAAIADGVVTAAEFRGAFRKDTTRSLYMRRLTSKKTDPNTGENVPY